jgi:SAM-dependent methyltransferase
VSTADPTLPVVTGLVRACLVCGNTRADFFRAEAGFTILACAGCGLRYLDPQPDALALEQLYAESYYRSDDAVARGYGRYTEEATNWRATFRDRLRFLPAAPATVLDVGAAAGFFVEQARLAGYDARGVEPSQWASRFANEELGQPVDTGTLEALGYAASSFQMVTAWEVIEHVPDPRAFLQEVARVLAPGGTFAFSTPDAGSLAARLSGSRWLGWRKVPEHLWFFDYPALQRLLTEAGFAVEQHRYVSLTVTLGFALEHLGQLLGLPLRAPKRLAEQPVRINPLYDLLVVARKIDPAAPVAPVAASGGAWWRWGLSLGLLALVGWQLVKAGGDLASHSVSLAPVPLLGACVGLAGYLAVACELWRRLVGALGAQLSYREAFTILFRSNLAKYLPGGVWNLVGRVVLAQRAGVPKLACTISLLMETACQVVAALLVGLLTLPVFAHGTALADPRTLGTVIVVLVLGMHPRILNGWLSLAERISGRELPRLPFSYLFVLGILACYTFNWLLLGGSFALLGQALSTAPLSVAHLGLLVGAFAVAWNVSVFAFFFPAGLGVREAALLLLLGTSFAPGWPAALALLARVWFTVGELVAFGVASVLARRKQR